MRFQCDVDLSDVFKGLERMAVNGTDLRPVWKNARRYIKDDIVEHYTTGDGPSGEKWPTWAPSTMQRRMERRGMRRRRGKLKGTATARAVERNKAKNLLGKIKNAWKFRINPWELTATAMPWWADVHQTGGYVGRGSRIPSRPFAWVSERLVDVIAKSISDYVAGAW